MDLKRTSRRGLENPAIGESARTEGNAQTQQDTGMLCQENDAASTAAT
jgi:hypothetical protein